MLAKEVVRCFNLYSSSTNEENLQTNANVDEFGYYRKVNFAYGDDDFVYQQKQMLPTRNSNQGQGNAISSTQTNAATNT